MKSPYLGRRYAHGAARIRLSIPRPAAHARHTLRDALALALAELSHDGWRAGLGGLVRWSAGLAVALLLALSFPFGVALQRTQDEFEPLAIYLERDEPPIQVAQRTPPPQRVEPPEPRAKPLPRPQPRPRKQPARAVRIDAVSAPPPEAAPGSPGLRSEPAVPRARIRRPAPPIASLAAPKSLRAVAAPAASFRLPQESRARSGVRQRAVASVRGVPELSAPAQMPELPATAVRVPSPPAQTRASLRPESLGAPPPGSASARASQTHNAIDGVPLHALAACRSDAEEDSLKQRLISAVGLHESCTFEMGSYGFLQMRNLNSFLLWVQREARREQLNRCGELRLALECLESQTRTQAGES